MCLRRLSSSLIRGLTSVAVWPVVIRGGACLPRLGPSHRVPFTDRFTDRVSDLGLLVLLGCRLHVSDCGAAWLMYLVLLYWLLVVVLGGL